MTPDDVCTVQQSWAELRRVRTSMITELDTAVRRCRVTEFAAS